MKMHANRKFSDSWIYENNVLAKVTCSKHWNLIPAASPAASNRSACYAMSNWCAARLLVSDNGGAGSQAGRGGQRKAAKQVSKSCKAKKNMKEIRVHFFW